MRHEVKIERSWARLAVSAMLGVLAIAGILCAGAVPAFCEAIQKSFATIANPAFLLHSHNGVVSVTGWDQNQVEITGDRASDAMDVIIEGNAEKVTIKTHPKRDRKSVV